MIEEFSNHALEGFQLPQFGIRALYAMTEGMRYIMVEIETTTSEPGTALRAPTIEVGLVPACKDTCYGDLKLRMWEKRDDGGKGKMILDATSNMAALEVGGGTTVSDSLVNKIVGTPVDVDCSG